MHAAIALGSNLSSRFGDKRATLAEALRRLGKLGHVRAVSALHETDPVGFTDQPRFLNGAALLETDRDPLALLQGLLALEAEMGRVRSADRPPKGPRTIDLDLLLYEDAAGRSVVLNGRELVLPHPEMHRRAFVLEPLAEIAPQMWHPVQGTTVGELLARLQAAPAVPQV
jgi:2-amino-4-hydroxy-6-hydroxymethyldihydropteridine diphosphokinase